MTQLYGQGPDKRWHPCEAVQDPETGTWVLRVDSEIEIDSASMNISNLKIGSVDQTKNTLRFLKVLENGTLVSVSVPTDLYEISDIQDTGAIKYYSFVTVDEDWYIMELTSTTARYTKGSGAYPTAWANRASHIYDYFYNIF